MNTVRSAFVCLLIMGTTSVVSLQAGETATDLVVDDLSEVGEALGVSPTGGTYILASLLGAVVDRLPPSPAPTAEWVGESLAFVSGARCKAAFVTEPGAHCQLLVLYDDTGVANTLGGARHWEAATGDGRVEWEWTPASENGGAVTLLLCIRFNGIEHWRSFTGGVSAP